MKAFSSSPVSFKTGLTDMSRLMKTLYVREVTQGYHSTLRATVVPRATLALRATAFSTFLAFFLTPVNYYFILLILTKQQIN